MVPTHEIKFTGQDFGSTTSFASVNGIDVHFVQALLPSACLVARGYRVQVSDSMIAACALVVIDCRSDAELVQL